MDHLTSFYIDGAWTRPSTSDTLAVVNPATETEFARVSLGGRDDVDAAVSAARRAFAAYSQTSVRERVELLDRIVAEYQRRYSDLVAAITAEIGAPTRFARQTQVGLALAHIAKARDLLKDYKFEHMLDGDIVRREAFGVCGLITAWNWPLNLVASKLAPALAAGCTVVLKPSEFAPVSPMILAEILHEARVPPGVFNLVNGTGPIVGQAIASHPDVDLVSFTGSVRGGIEVARAAVSSVKRVHQELGGKSANVVLPDADLMTAIPDAVRRCYINTGQSCIAPTRLLVHREQLPAVLEIAQRTADSLLVGDPTSEATDIGPLANANQFERVQSMIRLGIAEGARLVSGGLGRPQHCPRGFFAQPTIFADVSSAMTIAKEEIFGPVLSILSYQDIDEAIEIANSTVYGLAGYVSSPDRAKARYVANRLRAGRIFINGAPTNATAPFGGYKQSGNGREVGLFGLEEYLEIKAILGDKLD